MIPLEKVQALVVKHDMLEKELSSGSIDPKTFAQKSKEYSDLGGVIIIAREYIKFENDKKDLDQILGDKSIDSEITAVCRILLRELRSPHRQDDEGAQAVGQHGASADSCMRIGE